MKITKCKCPSCKGTGKGLFGTCMWCRGELKLTKADAIRWAEHVYMLGVGGYICGDHNLEDCNQMKGEANAVRKLFNLEPLTGM